MRFGSVCSGIEAASVAWHPLGWQAAWLSEIEPFPSAVLAHHYPNVPNLGDMTALPDRILSGEVEAPDLFCGGTPCQAFSVAGLRNSLDDARGNLSLTFVGIANAIDHVRSVRSAPPAIIFWENVPGVLSTKDNAFGCFLAALAGEDDPIIPSGEKWTNAGCVYGPQRAVAWRVLDAQYFGVAQRRRRVFVVASARDDFDPAAVLFEFDGVRRDTAPSREKGKESSRGAGAGASISSGHGYWLDAEDRAATLRAQDSITKADTLLTQPYPVANRLTARMHKGINSTVDEGQTPVIVHGTQDPAFVAQPIPLDMMNIMGRPSDDGTAYTVDTHATQGVAQPMVLMDQGGSVMNVEHDMVGTLRRETHGHEPVVAVRMVSFGEYVDDGTASAMKARDYKDATDLVAQTFSTPAIGHIVEDDVASTMTKNTGGGGETQNPAFVTQPMVFDTTNITSPANGSNPQPGDPCFTLAKGQHPPLLTQPVVYSMITSNTGSNGLGDSQEIAPTLDRAQPAAVAQPIPLNSMNVLRSADADPTTGCGIGEAGEAMFTLTKGNHHAVAQVVGALACNTGPNGHDAGNFACNQAVDAGHVLPVAQQMAYTTKLHNTTSNNAGKIFEERSTCLDANSPPPALLTAMQVRRLTPVECERLQGFPDNYTNIPWRKKPEAPDGSRYKALGNSWAVPNVRWIGKRIQEALNALT